MVSLAVHALMFAFVFIWVGAEGTHFRRSQGRHQMQLPKDVLPHNSSHVAVKPENTSAGLHSPPRSAAVTALINHLTSATEAHIHTVLYITQPFTLPSPCSASTTRAAHTPPPLARLSD